MRKSILLLFSLCVAFMLVACDHYDTWTQDASARLHFSSDTVSFDTVISTHSSSTRLLTVYNGHDKGIRIRSVALGQGGQSHFRVNVDGEELLGGRGEDFEVHGEDSIFIKMEVTLPEGKTDKAVHYEDELHFTLENGTVQKVLLTADAQDVYTLRGEVFQHDKRLAAGRPYLIYDSLVVAEGATLQLDPGVILMFHDSVSLKVRGRLLAEGTQQQPIVFRGDRLDRLFPYLPYDNTPDRWGGIHFYAPSRGNRMVQCDVHGGQYGILLDSLAAEEQHTPVLHLENSVVHNIKGPGIAAYCSSLLAVGTQVSNTLDATVALTGGTYTFVHCTLAQYYPFSAQRGEALYLANRLSEADEDFRPLQQAHFLNCVITGYAEDVITGNLLDSQDYPAPYLFSHSFLRTVKSDDAERFVQVVYEDEKAEPRDAEHFSLFDTYRFLYDFTPVEKSTLRDKADADITRRYSPTDRMGRSRLADGAPDMGAYEYVQAPPVQP